MTKTELATKIAEAILADATDRNGWGNEWDNFDEDTKDEIKASWIAKIEELLP